MSPRAKTRSLLAVGTLLGAAAVADVAVHQGHATFGIIVGALCATGLLAWGLWRKRHDDARLPWPRPVKRALGAAAALGGAAFVTASVLLLAAARDDSEREVDHLVVLGAGLSGGRITRTLALRLDGAADWLSRHPQTPVVVSGGRGADEPRSEAAAMTEYLVAKGIDRSRILEEDRSMSTWENVQNTRALLRAGAPERRPLVLIATSNFHLYRALFLGRRAGLDAYGLPCPTPWYELPICLLRECFANVKSGLWDR
jgi:uncharacterized SAM-binding protein YcdF (DUF218 family)